MTTLWTSILAKYPDAGIGVLVSDGHSVTAAALIFVAGAPYEWVPHGIECEIAEFLFRKNFSYGDITHWMPLPQPPGAEE